MRYLCRVWFVCTFLMILGVSSGRAWAQAWAEAEDELPLRGWAAPVYYQPATAEAATEAATGGTVMRPNAAMTPSAPVVLVAMSPCRLMDTRSTQTGWTGVYGPPAMNAAETRVLNPPSSTNCPNIPSTAVAYSLNFTAVPSTSAGLGYLSAWPDGYKPSPMVSILNVAAGIKALANGAVVPAGNGGSFDVYVTNQTNVIIDINGYYMPPAALALGGGAVSAPALTFGGDATTGLYSTATGSLSITTGGADRVDVNSTGLAAHGNLDFSGMITYAGEPLIRTDRSDLYVGTGGPSTLIAAENTAFGADAMANATTGSEDNTAIGEEALHELTTGTENTAVGNSALQNNQQGSGNTAAGEDALAMTTGSNNTAVGISAGQNVYGGSNNVAIGSWAMQGFDVTGNDNIAIGDTAGTSISSGAYNVVIGADAAYGMDQGSYNILIGTQAGSNLRSGNYNIDLGNYGASNDANTIRVGDSNQHRAFISGIRGVTTGQNNALTVVIDSNGQLGTVSSSRRNKHDIEDMGDTTERIMGLRPVRFRYNVHGDDGPAQYGLIAEEVAEVSPDLVARNKDGEIETVYYDKVNAMLLKQVQTQERLIEKLEARVSALENRAP